MEAALNVAEIAREIEDRLRQLPAQTVGAVREVRKEFSRRIAGADAESVIQLGLHLYEKSRGVVPFFAYEIVQCHKGAFAALTLKELLRFGRGLDSWSAVDSLAPILAGPMWAQGRIPDTTIAGWTRRPDRWWRRAALVSTVALSRRGREEDMGRTVRICALLVADRDDMVVKAQSWALRELAKNHPQRVRAFLNEHEDELAARVVREVNNKLSTGLKTPRRANARAGRNT